MNVLGFCVNCHKVKRVNVKLPNPRSNIQSGTCQDCRAAFDARGTRR